VNPIIQPKFTCRINGRPAFGNKKQYDLLNGYSRDYAIEVYFKENGTVGHKSRYTTGELAHHLMIEGQFSLSAKRRGRPHKQMSVLYNKLGLPRRNREGKYLLGNSFGYKKKWNFVEIAAKKHHNWKKEVQQSVSDLLTRILVRGLLGGSINGLNFYNQMRSIAKKIKKDVIEALEGLKSPKLSESTKKKKGHDKILQETKNLLRSISVRVVKIEPKKRMSPLYYGRKYAGSNAKLSPEEMEIVKGYLGSGGNAEGYLASLKGNNVSASREENNASHPEDQNQFYEDRSGGKVFHFSDVFGDEE